jgi:hypothetical protein
METKSKAADKNGNVLRFVGVVDVEKVTPTPSPTLAPTLTPTLALTLSPRTLTLTP